MLAGEGFYDTIGHDEANRRVGRLRHSPERSATAGSGGRKWKNAWRQITVAVERSMLKHGRNA